MEIEKKYISKKGWKRVIERTDAFENIEHKNLKGIASLISVKKVKEPGIKIYNNNKIKIVDDGFFWLQIGFENKNYWITAMYNEKKEIVQYYIDITEKNVINDYENSCFYDIFLDIVLLPDGEIFLLDEDELKKAYEVVKQEAAISFNDESIYIEKFIENPRHIEIQVMADEHGNAIHLGERDCTVQRRNQKMLEETPSGIIDSKLREKMGAVAVKAVKEVGYTNVGTIEFLVDENKDFYFMEMNTRIQVEHPVTEMVTGLDLVKEQIRIASGEKMKYKQKDIIFTGHSLEARINAENPAKNFMPCPGLVEELHLPGGKGIRVDTAVYAGYRVPQNYDSMIAKVIVHGKDRKESIAKMKSALSELVISGIETNTDFILKILDNEKFKANDYDTSFIEKEFGK